jgi:hypothetical protein
MAPPPPLSDSILVTLSRDPVSRSDPSPLARWLAALEARHLRDLGFAEVRRALQALSSLYVERRGRLRVGAAFSGAGKRAAFALYYGPLHFLLVREIVRELNAASPPPARVHDLGCGTGVAGAAWALQAGGRPPVEGVEKNAWASEEARWTLRALGLRGSVRRGDLAQAATARAGDAVVLAFTANELADAARERLRARLLEAAARGARVLVVEPLALRALPWWRAWAEAFVAAGGRADEWRFRLDPSDITARLARAAGLDAGAVGGRSLYLAR